VRLALYNFGVPITGFDAPDFVGFLLREPFNFEAAERADGFVGRSGYDGDPGPPSWGRQVFPRFIEGTGFESGTSSLSLWRDIESLMAFSYSGVHADALKNARNWMAERRWPPLVLWWVDDDHIPSWSDGVERLEYLHDHGVSARAFTFKQPYGSDGLPFVVDRARVREIADLNASRQQDLLAAVEAMKI
jgi:hypothetical protein